MRYIVLYRQFDSDIEELFMGESEENFKGTYVHYSFSNSSVVENYIGKNWTEGQPRTLSSIFFLDDEDWKKDLFEEIFG